MSRQCPPLAHYPLQQCSGGAKEYVASLIGLYKNNGAVSRAGIFFLLIETPYKDTDKQTEPIAKVIYIAGKIITYIAVSLL